MAILTSKSPPQSKRSTINQPVSTYWDNLSKIWLTRNALRELNRRNSASCSVPKLPRSTYNRPLTRQHQADLKRRHQALTPDPSNSCNPETLSEIKRFARGGGPDLSDLRGFPDPHIPLYQPMRTRNSGYRKRRATSPPTDESSSKRTNAKTLTTAYSQNFEQKLADYGVYLDGYEHPDGRFPAMPNNMDEIHKRLTRSRRSLSPSHFSEGEFRRIKREDTNATNEKPVITSVIPAIEGNLGSSKCRGGDYLFGNLALLTDGSLAVAKPDHFFGAHPGQLDPQIRDELSEFIIPSTQTSKPIVPNFFLEVKSPDGSVPVATRQACYYGALGARGIHKLQSYKLEKATYDNNAYTITSTYHCGTLKLYTMHLSAPSPQSKGHPEYIMTSLRSFAMMDNLDTFRQGAAAYRNARDWAKEQRDEFIRVANERHTRAMQEFGATAELTIALDGSETSSKSDEAEFHDAT